jgi:hypothetical protein
MRRVIIAVALVVTVVGAEATGPQEKLARPAAPPAAKEAAERYSRLNMEGAALNAKGRAEVAALLLGPAPEVPREILVIEHVDLGEPEPTGPGTAVVVAWRSLAGSLDTATARFRSPAPGLLGKDEYDLRLVGEQWKVSAVNHLPFVGVPAAEQYVKDLVATSKDPVVQRNAKHTLAALKKLAGRGM